jgi:hypothetical protein
MKADPKHILGLADRYSVNLDIQKKWLVTGVQATSLIAPPGGGDDLEDVEEEVDNIQVEVESSEDVLLRRQGVLKNGENIVISAWASDSQKWLTNLWLTNLWLTTGGSVFSSLALPNCTESMGGQARNANKVKEKYCQKHSVADPGSKFFPSIPDPGSASKNWS